MAGRGLRSGELLPLAMLLKGSRAGILDGLRTLPPKLEADTDEVKALPAVDDGPMTEEASGLRDDIAVGVFDLCGGGAPLRVAFRLADGAFADLVDADGGGLLGVFDRGGAALGGAAASSSSRYLSPCTRKGRPYSSSQLSRILRRSASIFGKSLAMRFRIFSSRSRRVGSRFSPFDAFAMSLEASCEDAARSCRSLMSERCLSTIARVGARCSFSASRRAISASCEDSRASE